MDWRESDPSEEEIPQDQSSSRKRSSRACDQCRKTKSKCERGPGDGSPCKSCAIAGTACTFLGPSYKRGPPKGYIHAIEQRWHQVESLLGALMQCPDSRVQSVVADLRQDDLAREILNRVDLGPYGPAGRKSQPVGATKEDFFASVLRSNESSARDPSRSRRQSRMSREKVSSTQDRGLSTVPTQEWQDNLSRRLAASPNSSISSLPTDFTHDLSGLPIMRRRRIDGATTAHANDGDPADWSGMYTIESDSEEHNVEDPTKRLGQLSLDDNQEVRYHSWVSGLHLLARNRNDDRIEGGIWILPMARVWPPSKDHLSFSVHEENLEVHLPPQHIQDRFVDMYFTYIHPYFPVIHKSRFMNEYNARKLGQEAISPPSSTGSSPRPEPCQKLSPLLLLSMFATVARFCDDETPLPPNGKMWEAGCTYYKQARAILAQILDRSRPSTVQSLLLLGYREFGIGSHEQGWIFIGIAIRMAVDLGLNCNSDGWKHHGHELFSSQEKQTRRQIWWACVLADRLGSMYMGRPVLIGEDDFDVPVPEQDDVNDLWRPYEFDTVRINYSPQPSYLMSCFDATGELCVLMGRIISKIYSVRPPTLSRRTMLAGLERQLDRWYLSLPEHLRYDSAKRYMPPPHVVYLHIRYWATVLILHRAFIPNWKGLDTSSKNSTLELKAFDLAQSAASHISTLVTAMLDTFTLKRICPFMTSYILSAGSMHISTLTLRPMNPQASVGLKQCLNALKDMEVIWPSAARAWELLHGVKLGFDHNEVSRLTSVERKKRDAAIAFGQDKSSDLLQEQAFGSVPPRTPTAVRDPEPARPQGMDSGVQDLNRRIMAHMLGLDVPGIEPSTSFYPGYEWWPRQVQSVDMSPSVPAQAMPGSAAGGVGSGVGSGAVQNLGILSGSVSDPNLIHYGRNNHPADYGRQPGAHTPDWIHHGGGAQTPTHGYPADPYGFGTYM